MVHAILDCCCFLILSFITTTHGNNAGPVGDFNIFYVSACDPPVENDAFVNGELKTSSENEKSLDISFDIKTPIDENTEFLIIADKWENGAWQEETYKKDGKLIDFLKQYIPVIWENFRQVVEPPIKEDNYVEPGPYTLKDFQDMASNMELPQILYGRFRATVFLMNGDGEPMGCVMSEVESNPKM